MRSDRTERVGRALFEGCDISGGISFHIHVTGNGVGTYSLDLRRLLTIAGGVGLVVVPNTDGQPRVFILAATPAVREWVEQGFQSESPPWQVGGRA
jgi:hypothetical protein